MKDLKQLLELRNKLKKKKPKFVRHDVHKKRLEKKWVRPRGLHNKARLKKRGHIKPVSVGYCSPKAVRGLSRDGLKVRIIKNGKELESVDIKNEGIIIAKGVGLRKKLPLLKKAKEKGISVFNISIDDYIKKKEDELKKRKERKKEKKEAKKKEEPKKKKGKLEEKLSEEERKELEKKEKDKLLTKRER